MMINLFVLLLACSLMAFPRLETKVRRSYSSSFWIVLALSIESNNIENGSVEAAV
jgi:hypothetical protein